MAEMDVALDQYQEVETGEGFTLQNPRLLKVELSEGSVMAKNGSMVAYQGDVRFEHKGGGLGRLLKKAATGEQLRLMKATGSGEVFLAHQAMLVHMLQLDDDSLTANGRNILAFEAGIDWDVTRVKGERPACWLAASSTSTCGAAGTSLCSQMASRSGSTSRRHPPSATPKPRSLGPAA